MYLRGVSIHAEAPFRSGRVFSEADARTLLRWAKEVGCNFVRLPHYPHDEVMTRIADETGLARLVGDSRLLDHPWENPETLRNAEQPADRNDLARQEPRLDHPLVRRQRNPARRCPPEVHQHPGGARPPLDSTRLVTAALETHYADPRTIVVDDPLGKYLDVVSCNEYLGWYDGPPEKIDTITWKTAYEKPFVISEFGADAPAGRHGDDMTASPRNFRPTSTAARSPCSAHSVPQRHDRVGAGGFPLAAPPAGGHSGLLQPQGTVLRPRRTKTGFYILRDYYQSKMSAQ